MSASACMREDERSPFPAGSKVALSFWDLAERVSQVSKEVSARARPCTRDTTISLTRR